MVPPLTMSQITAKQFEEEKKGEKTTDERLLFIHTKQREFSQQYRHGHDHIWKLKGSCKLFKTNNNNNKERGN